MFDRTRSFFHRLTWGVSGHRSVEERRSWERFPVDLPIQVRIGTDPDELLPARIQDVVRGGIRILFDRPLDSGSMIRVELPTGDASTSTTVMACVVHVQPFGDNQFTIGCNFSTELSDNDLQLLGAEKARPAIRDQRAWARVPIVGEAIYSSFKGSKDPRSANIHNISPTGVAIQTNEELLPGTLLNLELRRSDGHSVLTIVACVVYLTGTANGEWLAGCNFVRELYDEDLSALIAPAAGQ